MEDLNSMEEWLEYINQIPMIEMINHAKVIGSVSFYEELDEQGYEDDEVMALYNALALRFLQLNMRVPDMMDNARVNFRVITEGVLLPN
jgi:hypothetical protein